MIRYLDSNVYVAEFIYFTSKDGTSYLYDTMDDEWIDPEEKPHTEDDFIPLEKIKGIDLELSAAELEYAEIPPNYKEEIRRDLLYWCFNHLEKKGA